MMYGNNPQGSMVPSQGATAQARRARSRWERGQTLVVMALMMVGLVGFLALVVDLGSVYAQRRQIQNAADAAALAGARALALKKSPATAIDEYRGLNGADTAAYQVQGSSVVVTVSKTCKTYFAAVIGVPTFTVPAVAVAGYTLPGSWTGGLMPIAVHVSATAIRSPVQIYDDDKTFSDYNQAKIANGERGWLNYNGGEVGVDELKYWAKWGYPGTVTVPMWINGSPGSNTSALSEITKWIGQIVYFPVYDTSVAKGVQGFDPALGDGNVNYRIVGFAAFNLTAVKDTTSAKSITGQFVDWVVPQEGGGSVDTGVRVIGLQR